MQKGGVHIDNPDNLKNKHIMADYTRFSFNALLRSDTPKAVLDALSLMLDPNDSDDAVPVKQLPEHPFFRTFRWSHMLWSGSAYHQDSLLENGCPNPTLEPSPDGLRLKFLCSFINYDGEVRLFCDWIAPHLADSDGTELGSVQFEDAQPSRLIIDRGAIVFLDIERPQAPYDGYGIIGS